MSETVELFIEHQIGGIWRPLGICGELTCLLHAYSSIIKKTLWKPHK